MNQPGRTMIEVKYGQDNVSAIQQAMLRGLSWDNLDEATVKEFCENLVVYTKLSDYRFVDHQFQILGNQYPDSRGLLRHYTIALRRTKRPHSNVPSDCVSFEAYIVSAEDVNIDSVRHIVSLVTEEGGKHVSAAVIHKFTTTIYRCVKTGPDCDIYRVFNFQYGGMSDGYVTYNKHGVQP